MSEPVTRDHPPVWLELAAALLVPAAVVGFSRVFDDMSAIIPIAGAALMSSAVAVVGRRLRLPLTVTAVVSIGLLMTLIVYRYAPGTTRFGILPSGETLDVVSTLLDDLVVNFREMKSPVPAIAPFVGAAMVGAWLMAFLTDWGAMRLRLAFEPVFPAALLFVFTAIPPISAGRNRVLSTAVLAAAIALWAVCQRAYKLTEQNLWLPNHERRGPATVARIASTLAAIAVVGGTVGASRLPFVDDEPMYSFSEQRDPTRQVVSPFVNIDKRLVEQTDQVLFVVQADQPSYWRIAGLDTYEDNIWKVAGDFSPEDGDLPGQALGGTRQELEQIIQIRSLAAIWLPAAFAPARIVETTADLTWNGETSSLTVSNDIPTSDGVDYTIVSSLPDFSADDLRAASEDIPEEIAARYLTLPDPGSITPRVRELAEQLTAGQTTRYDKMRALQDHFRNNYGYSINLGPGGADPIATFLDERRGFCQQFSGTFALMARSIGVPTRVATGFTWGDPSTNADGQTVYTVTGRHTHAWPEVYFEGLGWVPFEPTPGRGLPGAARYTGATPEQDSEVEQSPPSEQAAPVTPPQVENQIEQPVPETPAAEEVTTSDGIGLDINIPWRLLIVPAIILLYIASMLGFWRFRRTRRRSRATDPGSKVANAWTEACETLSLGFDVDRLPAETRTEFAGRLVDGGIVGSEPMQELAELSTTARFYPEGILEPQVKSAISRAAEVERLVHEAVPARTRVSRMLDPRRLIHLSSDRRKTIETRWSDPTLDQRAGELVELSD
jgi:transglutaminase-like putative cysteine protease